MFTKKAPAKKTNGAKTQSPSSPFTNYLIVVLVIIVAVNAAISYFAYDIWIVQQERKQLSQIAQDYAQKHAQLITDYIRDTRKLLQTYTSRDDLLQAARDNDQNSLLAVQSQLRRQLANVRGLRIDARGTAQVDPDGEVPVSFAEVDMINRASRREQVLPEAVRRNSEMRVNMVEPIPMAAAGTDNPEPVVATLFVSLSASDLLTKLSSVDLSQGQIQVMQKFGQGDPQLLVELGQGGGGASEDVPIPQSHWLIRFSPSPVFAEQAHVSATLLIAVLFLIAVATIALGVMLAERLSRATVARNERIAMAQTTAAQANAAEGSGAAAHKKIVDLKVKEEDVNILNLKERGEVDPLDISDAGAANDGEIPISIFRSYDIRGIVPKQLNPTTVVLIGKAIGSQALETGEKTIVVGRDGRTHSNDVSEQLIEGILSTGCNVINLGMVPTPMVYFAIAELQTSNSGVSVTASHNPAEYNGFKIVINGKTLVDEEIRSLHSRIVAKRFARGAGKEDFTDLSFQYIDKIASDIALVSDLKVVVDAGNGVAGDIAPRVFTEIGCEVIPLHCKVDGKFPNHEADPSVTENLQDLINKVRETGADLGIALDGDGDRLGIITASGAIIWPDRLLMLLAKDILSRNPGTDVIFDVKCSRELNSVIATYGGRPIMSKSGHSHMKGKMQETGAMLGGELSGHIFISERWYGFDDGVYTACRIMEIMSMREQDLDSIFESFPALPATPEIKVAIADEKKFAFMKRLVVEGEFNDGRITTIDGLRVDFAKGWGLVRASNTSPALTLRFEADTKESMAEIKARFKEQMKKVDPQLDLSF